jgi:restriction system protein
MKQNKGQGELMAIPDFQSMMLPLLVTIDDGQEHQQAEVHDALAEQFSLSDQDKSELLPSGRQKLFDNRVSWAKAYLKMAGLVETTSRGKCRITPRGADVLKNKPSRIDIKFLMQFPEFAATRNTSRQTTPIVDDGTTEEGHNQTPEELLESSYQNLRRTLAKDLLDRVKQASPRFFEMLVIDLLVAMGYGGSRKDAGEAVGQSGDGGIDGIIKEDKLGLDAIYIQAKRWDSTVGRPLIQAFAGSLEGQRSRKGVFITTSQFSQDAKDYVNRIEKKIVLIDGEQLAQLMIDHGIGVAEIANYVVKRIDQDYFSEE